MDVAVAPMPILVAKVAYVVESNWKHTQLPIRSRLGTCRRSSTPLLQERFGKTSALSRGFIRPHCGPKHCHLHTLLIGFIKFSSPSLIIAGGVQFCRFGSATNGSRDIGKGIGKGYKGREERQRRLFIEQHEKRRVVGGVHILEFGTGFHFHA